MAAVKVERDHLLEEIITPLQKIHSWRQRGKQSRARNRHVRAEKKCRNALS